MKHVSKSRWCKILCTLAIMYICVVLIYAIASREMAISGHCQENMRLIYQTTAIYAMDYDSHYPLEAHWTDSLKPYAHTVHSQRPKYDKTKMFSCPVLSHGSGYGYNADLSSKSLSSVLFPETTVMLFETDHLEINYSSHKTVLPANPRHGGNWELYADGHRRASH